MLKAFILFKILVPLFSSHVTREQKQKTTLHVLSKKPTTDFRFRNSFQFYKSTVSKISVWWVFLSCWVIASVNKQIICQRFLKWHAKQDTFFSCLKAFSDQVLLCDVSSTHEYCHIKKDRKSLPKIWKKIFHFVYIYFASFILRRFLFL